MQIHVEIRKHHEKEEAECFHEKDISAEELQTVCQQKLWTTSTIVRVTAEEPTKKKFILNNNGHELYHAEITQTN